MELLKLDYLGQPVRVEGTMSGWQELFVNNRLVSTKSASPEDVHCTVHEFEVHQIDGEQEQVYQCCIQINVQWHPFEVCYQLYVDGQLTENGKHRDKSVEQQINPKTPVTHKLFKLMSFATVAMKLFKSAKVLQAFYATVSLVLYSWLFSLNFAVILIATLVVHELGHILMVKHFGGRPKGLYLIPFIGGLANHERMVSTRWQAACVALAGPVFGLFMSLFYLLLYGITGDVFFGALCAFNALLNLFNLLPVLPLDGGQMLKQVSFSMTRTYSLMTCLCVTIIGCLVSFGTGMTLVGLLMLIGCTEIIVAWQQRYKSDVVPMPASGIYWISVGYLLLVLSYVGLIGFFAGMGDDVLGLPLEILYS